MRLESLDGACAVQPTVLKKDYVPVKTLINRGYVKTEEVLKSNGIDSVADGNGNQVFTTLHGEQKLPEMITEQAAQALPAALAQLNTLKGEAAKVVADNKDNLKKAGCFLLFLLVCYGTYRILKPKKKPQDKSMSGLPEVNATRLDAVTI